MGTGGGIGNPGNLTPQEIKVIELMRMYLWGTITIKMEAGKVVDKKVEYHIKD